MPIYRGNTELVNLGQIIDGTTNVQKVYVGSNQIWPLLPTTIFITITNNSPATIEWALYDDDVVSSNNNTFHLITQTANSSATYQLPQNVVERWISPLFSYSGIRLKYGGINNGPGVSEYKYINAIGNVIESTFSVSNGASTSFLAGNPANAMGQVDLYFTYTKS